MSSERSQLWMRACIAKGKDRLAAVPCPICKNGSVQIEDLFSGDKPVEARFFCSACNAESFARVNYDHLDKDTPLAQLPTRSIRH